MKKTISVLFYILVFGVGGQCMAAADDVLRPHEHLCPITQEVMRTPVVAADGYSYEKEAIEAWFASSGGAVKVSPRTNTPLASTDLITNIALRTMIMDWKPGTSSMVSSLDSIDSITIADRVRVEFEKHADLLHSSKGRDIVAFLGNTGAGKSTVVNLLAGKELVVSGEDYVLSHPEDPTSMPIGTSGDSETLYPKSIQIEDQLFFDLPGFNDTDGSERNLVNAAFIRQILLEANSVRFVFVLGQDQFTADRGESVKKLLATIQRLSVTGAEDLDLIGNSVCVVTKSTCKKEGESIDFLLKKVKSDNKPALEGQLRVWTDKHRLCHMYHASISETLGGGLEGAFSTTKDRIKTLIQGTNPAKIAGINVSVLYPPETKGPLTRMFLTVMERDLEERMTSPVGTLLQFDEQIALYSHGDFWKELEKATNSRNPAIGLLREFCIDPYNEAFKTFLTTKETSRQSKIEDLKKKRGRRVEDIVERTGARTEEVIDALVPKQSDGKPLPVDFSYHKDYYDRVCGGSSIGILAEEPVEQVIVRSSFADYISRHIEEQMKGSFLKYESLAAERARVAQLEAAAAERRAAEEAARCAMPIPPVVPAIALGHEALYQRLMGGRLEYRPTPGSDAGLITLSIGDLLRSVAGTANPLSAAFDLSGCQDVGKYISINIGYKKAKITANANKLEVWLCPKFLAERELSTTASSLGPIMSQWVAPVGYFWTWGGRDVSSNNYDYLLTPFAMENDKNIYEKHAIHCHLTSYPLLGHVPYAISLFPKNFHVLIARG